MDGDNTANATLDARGPAIAPNNASPGLIHSVETLWADLRGVAYDHLLLATLEVQRAGESFAAIMVYGFVISALLISAWLGTACALVLWLIDNGFTASVALLLVALFNLLGAIAFAMAIRRKSHFLRFPATVRSLTRTGKTATAVDDS